MINFKEKIYEAKEILKYVTCPYHRDHQDCCNTYGAEPRCQSCEIRKVLNILEDLINAEKN